MTYAVMDKTKIATVEGNITVYNFSAQTGEYTGSSEEYLAIGIGLPAYSTDIAPGVAGDGYVMVFSGQEWDRQEDHRGETVYSVEDRTPVTIDYIGAIKDGFTTSAPSSPFDKWDGDKWLTDNDAQHAADVAAALAQQQTLRMAADASISWLQDAADFGEATGDETAKLTLWKKYRILLMRVDTSIAPDINWPVQPQ